MSLKHSIQTLFGNLKLGKIKNLMFSYFDDSSTDLKIFNVCVTCFITYSTKHNYSECTLHLNFNVHFKSRKHLSRQSKHS